MAEWWEIALPVAATFLVTAIGAVLIFRVSIENRVTRIESALETHNPRKLTEDLNATEKALNERIHRMELELAVLAPLKDIVQELGARAARDQFEKRVKK